MAFHLLHRFPLIHLSGIELLGFDLLRLDTRPIQYILIWHERVHSFLRRYCTREYGQLHFRRLIDRPVTDK